MYEQMIRKQIKSIHPLLDENAVDIRLVIQNEDNQAAFCTVKNINAVDSDPIPVIITQNSQLLLPDDKDFSPQAAFIACNVYEKLYDNSEAVCRVYLYCDGDVESGESLYTGQALFFLSGLPSLYKPQKPQVIQDAQGRELTWWTTCLSRKQVKKYQVRLTADNHIATVSKKIYAPQADLKDIEG